MELHLNLVGLPSINEIWPSVLIKPWMIANCTFLFTLETVLEVQNQICALLHVWCINYFSKPCIFSRSHFFNSFFLVFVIVILLIFTFPPPESVKSVPSGLNNCTPEMVKLFPWLCHRGVIVLFLITLRINFFFWWQRCR